MNFNLEKCELHGWTLQHDGCPEEHGCSCNGWGCPQCAPMYQKFNALRCAFWDSLVEHTTVVLEDEFRARRWLTTFAVGLGGKSPVEYILEAGNDVEVRKLLGRMERGVY